MLPNHSFCRRGTPEKRVLGEFSREAGERGGILVSQCLSSLNEETRREGHSWEVCFFEEIEQVPEIAGGGFFTRQNSEENWKL